MLPMQTPPRPKPLTTKEAQALIAASRTGGGGSGRRPAVSLGRPKKGKPVGVDKPRSFFRQVGDAFLGIPRGVQAIGAATGRELWHDIRGIPSGLNPAQKTDPIWNHPDPRAEMSRRLSETAPLSSMLATSAGHTAGRVRHPSRYADAVREGRIVDAVVEDLANASIVAAPAAKGLSVAGLPRAAAAVEKAGALGGETANLPFSIARELVVKPLDRGLRSGLAKYDTLRLSRPDLLTPEGMGARLDTRNDLRAAQLEKTQVVRHAHRTAEDIKATAGEENAAFAEFYGAADAYRQARDSNPHIDPEVHRQNIAVHDRPEQTFSTGGREVIDAIDAGRLDPQAKVRVDRIVDELHRQSGELGTLYDPGEGRFVGRAERPGDPRQTVGDKPLGEHVLQRARERGANPPPPGLDPLDWGQVEGWLNDANASGLGPVQVAEILADPNIYPSRFRPSLQSVGRATGRVREVAEWEQLPADPANPAGRIDPTTGAPVPYPAPLTNMPAPEGSAAILGGDYGYLPGGASAILKGPVARIRTNPTNEGLYGIRPLASQSARMGGVEMPYSLKTLAEKVSGERFRIRANQSADRIRTEYGHTAGPDPAGNAGLLDPADLNRIEVEARAQANAESTGEAGYRLNRGQKMLDEMKAKGYEPWAENMDPTRGVRPDQLDPAKTVWLHTGLRARLAPWWTPHTPTGGWAVLERFNGLFKRSVLPFSIRWQVGDAVGNAYMGWLAGKVNPAVLIGRLHDVAGLRKAGHPMYGALDEATAQASMSYPEAQWLSSTEGAATMRAPRTILGRKVIRPIQSHSFAFNTAMNRFERQAYLLEKVERTLADKGMPSTIDKTNPTPVTDPAVRDAIETAVDDAGRVLGDMDNLTPFERSKMRNIFTFYPWIRHVTQLAWNLAIDNPIRLVWAARIGSIAADDNELPPFMRGSIKTPIGYFQPSFLNPLADVGVGPVFTPEGALRSVSPAIKIGAAVAGLDANRMFLPISRPPDTGRLDEYGRPGVTPLGLPGHWGELAYVAARQFPLPREALNLLPQGQLHVPLTNTSIATGPVARWGTGEGITQFGKPIDTDPRAYSPLHLVGIPTPETQSDVDKAMATIRRRRRQNRKP